MPGQAPTDEFQRLMSGSDRLEQLKRVVRTSSKVSVDKPRLKNRIPLRDITNSHQYLVKPNRNTMKITEKNKLWGSQIKRLHSRPIRHDLGHKSSIKPPLKEGNYAEITKQIVMLVPYTNVNKFEDIRLQANHYIRDFVGWYKLNNYNFVHSNKDLPKLRLEADSMKSEVLHLPSTAEKNLSSSLSASLGLITASKLKPKVTHTVQRVTLLGNFMLSATVRCLKTGEVSTCLLARPDTLVVVTPDDFLELLDEHSHQQTMNGSQVIVYSRWIVHR